MFLILSVLAACFAMTSCCRSRNEVWDDTKSCGRHIKRGLSNLGGKHGDSKQVRCREEFICQSNGDYGYNPNDDFIPLSDMDYGNEVAMADFAARPARQSPGDPGSAIPGIEAFRDPATMPEISDVYRNLRFPFDSSLIKGRENLSIITSIAEHMKRYPNIYIFVEGHCDERGAEAYNLALGARRANAVRNALVKEGVSPDNIFTISYGKERPLIFGHDENVWSQNRRGEFKVYHH